VQRPRPGGQPVQVLHLKSAFGSLAEKIFDKSYPSSSKALFHLLADLA
jgi:hypothetical protein